MEGRIKFVDPKTKKWGFIVPSDSSVDVTAVPQTFK